MADENKLLKSCKGRRKSRWSDVKRPPMLVAELLELLQAMPDTAHAVIHISVADVDGARYCRPVDVESVEYDHAEVRIHVAEGDCREPKCRCRGASRFGRILREFMEQQPLPIH